MKKTKIQLNTESGRILAETNTAGCLGLLGYICGIIILLLNFANFRDVFVKDFLGVDSLDGPTLYVVWAIILAIGTVLAYFSDFFQWIFVIFKSFKYVVLDPLFNVRTKSLFLKKIHYDLLNSKLDSQQKIKRDVETAIKDTVQFRKVIRDSGNDWINNKDFWELDQEYFSNELHKLIVENFPVLEKDIALQYKNEIEKIKNLKAKLKKDNSIEFFVAAVQPAFYISLKRVIKDSGIERNCFVNPNTLTGPQTVSRCMEVRSKLVNNNKKIIGFIAPLSAFVTVEYKNGSDKNHDPREYFCPIINLTNEEQYLFYLEGNTSIPQPKGNLFFLNNSTAEECVALLNHELDKRFIPYSIDDFSDYTRLLNGLVLSDGTKLKKGDGIILWSPLSDHFDYKDVNSDYLLGKDQESNFEFKNSSLSKIMLFGDKDLNRFDSELKEIYKSITYAFILRVALTHSHLVKNNWTKLRRRIGDWWEATRVFNDGHETIFEKLFK